MCLTTEKLFESKSGWNVTGVLTFYKIHGVCFQLPAGDEITAAGHMLRMRKLT
jgi:hypothetical protein